jgi:hypothetical protein
VYAGRATSTKSDRCATSSACEPARIQGETESSYRDRIASSNEGSMCISCIAWVARVLVRCTDAERLPTARASRSCVASRMTAAVLAAPRALKPAPLTARLKGRTPAWPLAQQDTQVW